eukprot:gnl/MRDRNA2_/MRDRNA2_145651_c0_seq1.p1 gnl/MRDRNA2_/MRDRNA2_145651_c0~~gnl/MRDRNA2_/MRDRNA2_145651_c0_seq1.p1  ORF type:complete len:275 (+),score=38.87 gnl/MRDRNA2_/MRDRNA2_145651_c0_seq1:126-950(+)
MQCSLIVWLGLFLVRRTSSSSSVADMMTGRSWAIEMEKKSAKWLELSRSWSEAAIPFNIKVITELQQETVKPGEWTGLAELTVAALKVLNEALDNSKELAEDVSEGTSEAWEKASTQWAKAKSLIDKFAGTVAQLKGKGAHETEWIACAHHATEAESYMVAVCSYTASGARVIANEARICKADEVHEMWMEVSKAWERTKRALMSAQTAAVDKMSKELGLPGVKEGLPGLRMEALMEFYPGLLSISDTVLVCSILLLYLCHRISTSVKEPLLVT